MNRIDSTFKQGKVFAAYITAGDGSLETQLDYIRALLAGGVNLLEIGVPFSDPIADGPVIQRAMQRALNAGTTLKEVIALIKAVRQETEVPIVVFTYYNPVKSPDTLTRFHEAGADGILIVDCPFDSRAHHSSPLHQIAVIAPTTPPERIKILSEQGQGFLYYACQKGTTGARKALPDDLPQKIAEIKQITDMPVIVGFGIADAESAQAATSIADGFVVGSHFIEAMESGVTPAELKLGAQCLL